MMNKRHKISDVLYKKLILNYKQEVKANKTILNTNVTYVLSLIEKCPKWSSYLSTGTDYRLYNAQDDEVCELNQELDVLFHDAPYCFRYYNSSVGFEQWIKEMGNPMMPRDTPGFGYPAVVCLRNPKFNDGRQEYHEMMRLIPGLLWKCQNYEGHIFSVLVKEYLVIC
jgi:hypothetical protein